MTDLIYKLFYVASLRSIILLMSFLVIAWAGLERYFLLRLRKKWIWQVGNGVCWLCLVFVILSVTVSSKSVGATEVQWMPFYSFKVARIQPEIYRSMLMNVFLFFPLGLTMPYALPPNWKHNVLIAILFALILSIAIEFLQYYFCLGRAETDDVICNTLGCAIGTIAFRVNRTFRENSNSN